jgi:hypothetical protein
MREPDETLLDLLIAVIKFVQAGASESNRRIYCKTTGRFTQLLVLSERLDEFRETSG